MANEIRQKMKKNRLTGLFRKESSYGVFWTGTLADGTQLMVHRPFKNQGETDNPAGPEYVLSMLVPDEEGEQPAEA